ncbi:MAG: DUF465 domain-containing protein [Campylobacteraceae bacterium]|nr:DUF465 domain-containing protein [Campylobacteraceae bacterium]
MFHEYRDTVNKLKKENGHFLKLFEKHNNLDEEITVLVKNFANDVEIEKLKKEKLRLKDEIFTLILKEIKAS